MQHKQATPLRDTAHNLIRELKVFLQVRDPDLLMSHVSQLAAAAQQQHAL